MDKRTGLIFELNVKEEIKLQVVEAGEQNEAGDRFDSESTSLDNRCHGDVPQDQK